MSVLVTARPASTLLPGEWLCSRCGFRFTSGKPNEARTCGSCREAETNPRGKAGRYREIVCKVEGLHGSCYAWMGEFDDDDNPIDQNGFAIIAGERLCGHRDCVRADHIVRAVLVA